MTRRDDLVVPPGASREAAKEVSVDPLPTRIGKKIAPYLYLFSTVIFAGALAADPVGRIFIAPLVLVAVSVAGFFLTAMIAARNELRAIVSDRKVRVLHGLEHGCVAILEEKGFRPRSGATREGNFSIVVEDETPPEAVLAATREAVRRFSRGDTELAYSPYCGTSMIVGITMFAVIIVGITLGAIVFGIGAGPAFLGAAVLGVIAQMAWRPLGLLAQRTLTVSTRFARAIVTKVVRIDDVEGRRAYDVTCHVTL